MVCSLRFSAVMLVPSCLSYVLKAGSPMLSSTPRATSPMLSSAPIPRPPSALAAHGSHVVMDFEGFFCDAAEGGEWMIDTLAKTATAHGVTVVHQKLVQLPQSPGASPPGFTAVCLLDESHATAHCYSDRGWLALDVFTCGGTDPRPVAADIRAQVETRWGARCVQFETHGRFLHHATSIPAPTHEIERKIIAALPLRTTKLQLRQGGGDAEEQLSLASRVRGGLRAAWARYVLLRPDWDVEDLKNSTRLRTARSWSWEERTPGTARTIYISAALVTLFALPMLLSNPMVLAYLLETAALSREGISPADFWGDVLKDLFERTIGERPAF